MPVNNALFETTPAAIQAILADAALITVIKNKPRSFVYRIQKEPHTVFLKITPKGQLQTEAEMTFFLSRYGTCPKVLHYASDHNKDYLITEELEGIDASNETHLSHPELLTDTFAKSLASFHRIETKDCPISNGRFVMKEKADRNYMEGKAEKGLLRYLGYTSADQAYRDMLDLFETCSRDEEVVIHGDYCLPNLILRNFERSGYIDVGYGGIGDRHYDIFWALWSLQFNLRGCSYNPRFINTYGRDLIDPDKLRLFGLLSAFNGFRGQDYYE